MKKKNYGFKLDEKREEDYIFGASLPMNELQADGDWSKFLPVREYQNLNAMESYACVTFTALNAVETLIKRQYGVERNYSDRFLAYVSGTKDKNGNSPREVCDFLRKIGVVTDDLLPFDESINTYDKFYAQPNAKLYELAQEFNREWDFRYERVPENAQAISMALKCSPLLVSVSAWHLRGDKYYRPKGFQDNHATTMFLERAGDFRRVFDSYEPHIKDVEWDSVPMQITRFWIKKREDVEKEISIIKQLIAALRSLMGLMEKPTLPEVVVPPVVVEAPKPEPKRSYLVEWAIAIRDYEGKPGDLSYKNNNPGNLRSVQGPFLKFKTWEEGWNALLDYLTRAATGKHKAYKPEFTLLRFFQTYAPTADSNDPNTYAKYVAKRLGVPVTIQIKNLI